MATQYWHSTDMSEISSRTKKKSITKPLLKGVGGIKLSREAWFSRDVSGQAILAGNLQSQATSAIDPLRASAQGF